MWDSRAAVARRGVMRYSRVIPARRSTRPSAAWLRALVGGAPSTKPKKAPARSRVMYPPEMDRVRRRLEVSAMWTQVPGLRLVLHGQLPSGKNQVGICREEAEVPFEPGKVRRHPNARFERWRRDAEKQLLLQVGQWRALLPMSVPLLMYIWYWPGDRRTRDRSGMKTPCFTSSSVPGLLPMMG